jgi:hypothetical protein
MDNSNIQTIEDLSDDMVEDFDEEVVEDMDDINVETIKNSVDDIIDHGEFETRTLVQKLANEVLHKLDEIEEEAAEYLIQAEREDLLPECFRDKLPLELADKLEGYIRVGRPGVDYSYSNELMTGINNLRKACKSLTKLS